MARGLSTLHLICVLGLVGSSLQASFKLLDPLWLRNKSGLRLVAVMSAERPTVRVILPGHAVSDRSIEVLVPEHVTAVRHGESAGEHLFLPRSDRPESTAWRSHGHTLEYQRELPGPIAMVVRATLEDDGV